jgi:hypothetical protein
MRDMDLKKKKVRKKRSEQGGVCPADQMHEPRHTARIAENMTFTTIWVVWVMDRAGRAGVSA